MGSVKIFLASSSELADDRREFKNLIERKNKLWHDKGTFLDVEKWENFIDSISQTRLQDEYNKVIKECDIFIMLFFTKVGKYTLEEFETAFGQFKEANRPKIYTYFKDAPINSGKLNKDDVNSLDAFKKRLEALGHFLTVYENVDQLQWKFGEQLDKLAAEGYIKIDSEEGNKFLPKELTLTLPKTHPNDIIGREHDLEELHRLLNDDKRVVVVNGLGGIGKTTLAQAYVTRYYDEYNHIAWIDQTTENIAKDFINSGLVEILGIPAAAEPKKIFEDIIRKLKGLPGKPNLLVIDNAESSLKRIIDILPSQPQWHVLATSRGDISGLFAKPLDFLSEGQAIELFNRYYKLHTITQEQIQDLVTTVDYHTLTIELLAKTAQVQRYDADTLKQAIEKDVKANVEVKHSRGANIEKIGSYLGAIFSVSGLNDNEIWLLKNLACLPAEYHQYNLIKELIVDEEGAYNDIFSETLYDIVQKSWLLQNSETDTFKMHPIIADVVPKQFTTSINDIQPLIKSIADRLYYDDEKDNPVNHFSWVPFGKNILKLFNENNAIELSELQNNLAMVLQDLGDYEGACLLLQKAVASTEKHLGPDHEDTLLRYSNLALVLKDLGDYSNAQLLLEKVVISSEKTFGSNHHITAQSYSDLATVLQVIGKYHDAKLLLEKAALADEKNFGAGHPSTARRYSNLAVVLHQLGDNEGARSLLEKVVQFSEANLGLDHPTTALRYSNLAMVLRVLGNYEGARSFLAKAVVSDEKNFGVNHPNTANSYTNLALVLDDLGEYAQALIFMEKTLSSFKRNLSAGHPNIKIAEGVIESIKGKMYR